jgi:acyl phosphate:glycerol-3-phosphate acyltransferase
MLFFIELCHIYLESLGGGEHMIILLAIFEFLCGSLMFSYWLGLAVKKDIRKVGDGNPGAFNLLHAAGFKIGLLGMLLDFLKGYLPLVIIIEFGFLDGMSIIPVAIAPILGHALSPFMKFRGGKGIAVTFGVWSALTRFEVSFVYAVIVALIFLTVKILIKGRNTSSEIDAFMVITGMMPLGIYLFLRSFPNYIIILWCINLLIMIFTSKRKLFMLLKESYTGFNNRKNK